jgi:phosphatidylserine/phosphatidylglycerophosphate/cardiolipin synthase-like enzyme
MATPVMFSRATSVAEALERLVRESAASIDAALYRLNHPGLARALGEAARRGCRVRLVLDAGKYAQTPATRSLLAETAVPFRLSSGRGGQGTKMHHKFVIFDGRAVTTGSYNWTLESEEENYENLLVLGDPPQVEPFRQEFEALWEGAKEA